MTAESTTIALPTLTMRDVRVALEKATILFRLHCESCYITVRRDAFWKLDAGRDTGGGPFTRT